MPIARRQDGRTRGQSLAEFALVLPILMLILGGIVQLGMVFWAQNTLTQVVRDTGRWAATQQGCSVAAVDVSQEANTVAANSSLLGYSTPWPAATSETVSSPPFDSSGDTNVQNFPGTNGEGVAVAWVVDSDPPTATYPTGQGCPPKDSTAVYHVTVKIVHSVPVFIPLPGLPNNSVVLSSMAQFRMEPAP